MTKINWRAETATKCEKIEVGDFVRTYDFQFNDDSYVEGKVLRITEPMEGVERYEVMRLKRVWGGEVLIDAERFFYPPVNGTRCILDEFTNGVRKLDEEAAEYWREKWADWSSDVDID